ncbi:hypothetical protein IQ274_28755 [Nostoc sp. LEGE 12447]|uniref:hypothetical protein n=1 Tax=Nostoc sp. LEGE 12447 TaxID=1828640 RepID=UPI001884317E|nr:hypothetical protein [Nostoc sp. LEGE 12447]MBE9002085.1 hypothetical protein [Nostoc sp. LEGE 12447]
MKKFVVSTAMGIAIIAAIFPKTAQAHVGWKHTYYSGNYSVTLNEYSLNEYSYSASSINRNLVLRNGSSRNSGSSWIYSFNNSKTTYEIEDTWSRKTAYLSVIEDGQLVWKQNCSKSSKF